MICRFFVYITCVLLLGCGSKQETNDSPPESIEDYEIRKAKYEANQKRIAEENEIVHTDKDARPFDPEKAIYSLPNKFDYSLITDRTKLPKQFQELYPIGYSADYNYFCYITKFINEHGINFVLRLEGSGDKFKNFSLSLDSTNRLNSLDEVWKSDKPEIDSVLKKYRIIQNKPYDFVFKPGIVYPSDEGTISLNVYYQLTQLVTRSKGSTTTSEQDTIQIDLHAKFPNGDEKLMHSFNRAYKLIYGLQVPGAFVNEKNIRVLSVYYCPEYYHEFSSDKMYTHFEFFTIKK